MAVSNSTDRFNGYVASLAIKVPCAVVSTSNITLNGSPQTISGIVVESGDRVLVAGQTNAVENGIYLVTSSDWTRAPDFDGKRDATQHTLVLVARSGTQPPVLYQLDTADPVIVGSSALAFSLFSVGFDSVDSGSATDGYVLTADGVGGTAWEEGATPLTPWTENIDAAGYQLQDVEIDDYSLESSSPSSSSGAITFDIANGNAFQVTLTESITSITLSGEPASGKFAEIIIKFIQDSTGSWAITWPAAVKWPTGTAPTMTTTATTGVDLYYLCTWDGGTTWYANATQDLS